MSNSLQSCGLWSTRLLCPWDSPGKNTGVGSHSHVQRICPTQGSNPRVLHWQTYSLPLSHLGSPHSLCLPHVITHYCESIDFNTCNKWGSLVAQTVKNLPAVKETWVRSPGKGNGYPFQYSCLENPMDRGVWQAIVHGVAKSQMQLSETNNIWGSLS